MDTVASQSLPVESAQARPGQVGRVLLATDLRPISGRAAEEAIALAAQAGAELIVLSVIDPASLRLPGGRFLRRVDQERTRIQAEAQILVDRARAVGVRATFLVWEGDPVETILLAAASEACDLIVVGSHGRGRLGRMVLGSVSAGLTARAPGQVVVVPPGPGSTDS